ncbi:MAG TPA: thiamine phosphate synthase [Gemmatimonadaceae bacterium]|nr:thiamine phosphate synthase [Gemmatimonadaceae bacterium]
MKTHRHTFDPRLYLILDPAQTRGREVLSIAEQAVHHGATMVQLRWKDGSAREFAALARRLVDMLETHGIPLIVNDRIDIAWASGAHGAHVGQGDLELSDARAMLGRRAILGLSVTNIAEARNLPDIELDYVGLGPVFATSTKLDAAPPLGVKGFSEARALLRLPVVAIGGITVGNAASVVAAGANGIAVSSAICAADDPGDATRRLEEVLIASGAAAGTRSGAASFGEP